MSNKQNNDDRERLRQNSPSRADRYGPGFTRNHLARREQGLTG
jgi:hypothetical protein